MLTLLPRPLQLCGDTDDGWDSDDGWGSDDGESADDSDFISRGGWPAEQPMETEAGSDDELYHTADEVRVTCSPTCHAALLVVCDRVSM